MFTRRTRSSTAEQADTEREARPLPSSFPSLLPFRPAPSPQAPSSGPAGPPASQSPDVPANSRSRLTRSRASSIVSTRTGISIGTIQDDVRSTRSIDLTLGGRLFHINRDASRITVSEEGELPPYSPPAPAYMQQPDHAAGFPRNPITLDSPQHGAAQRPFAPWQSLNRAIADHKDVQTLSSADQTMHRAPSFETGPERLTVHPKRRSTSQGNIPDSAIPRTRPADENPRLRRRPGVRLTKIFTGLANRSETNLPGSGDSVDPNATSPDDPIVHSAGPSFPPQELQRPSSPNYIGRNATGAFPRPERLQAPAATGGEASKPQSYPILVIPEGPPHIEEGDGTEAPPEMESENDISIHYMRIIRSLDRDHRKALHSRDKDLAAMRERLNDVDQVYRKVLKARDFTIDDLQKRLANLEEQLQTKIERARNEVEDQWEMRWKHRDRQLMERMRRMELESQKQVEKAVARRDEEWVAELQKQQLDLLGKLGVDELRSAAEAPPDD